MKENEIMTGCAHCMSRRGFLAAGCAAACAGTVGLAASAKPVHAAAPAKGSFRIRVIYSLHAATQPGPDWPNIGFEFTPVMERINNALAKGCPEFEFLSSMAKGPEEADKIVEQDKNENIGGYIVYQMNCWNKVVQSVAKTGKPVLYADFPFAGSGGFLVYTAGFLREKAPNIGFVSSSRMKDLIAGAKCFNVVKNGNDVSQFVAATADARIENTPRAGSSKFKGDKVETLSPDEWQRQMKESKILAVRSQEGGPAGDFLGAPVIEVPFAELNDAWASARKDESKAVADRWEKTAKVIKDVSRETLETSAAMYLGMKSTLKKHGANAITVNCLGGFYGGHIHAYPCLGFHELCNEGLIGACECDVRSTGTMLAGTILTQGRPGYISDPVIDTSRRQIIYAHCVASNRAFGPSGKTNPFEILTHSEDRQGASVRSILPVGYKLTTLEINPEQKQVLFHQSKAVDNDRNDRACRTKICGEPIGDIEKLFTQWDQWSWHRVSFYGDLKEEVFAMADAAGFKVIQEA